MRLPICWLKDYVDFDDSVENLAEKLTFSGIEVEAIEEVGSDFSGLVVGEVLKVESHPNADRLNLVTVEFGDEQPLRVVCGAPNVEVGGKYPFAPLNSVLPGGFKIKKAKIRGEVSRGMLCAPDELGLSDSHEGLLKLDSDSVPGTPLVEVLGRPETVLELEITPNRPDCLSMIGVAREVAALYGTELKVPEAQAEVDSQSQNEPCSVNLKEPNLCPRYVARNLESVEVAGSPNWMQKRLRLAGLRPINNVVDITNFVLLECGQPLHAFDRKLLAEERVVVRRAQKEEELETLDGEMRELSEEMLVIADAEKPVALAGIMGGSDSEISSETDSILLESACFESSGIRATSKKLALVSDSSYRFQRGVDIGGVDWASRRAVSLLKEYAGAKLVQGVADIYPEPKPTKRVECSWESISKLLGIPVSSAEIKDVFESLGLSVAEDDGSTGVVEIPSFRIDLSREVDLAEEFIRIYGLDQLSDIDPVSRVIPGTGNERVRACRECRKHLEGLGASEIVNYTFTSPKLLDLIDENNGPIREVLPHPISADQSVLRPSLVPQMVETLARNHARQQEEALFFEIGRVFSRSEKEVEQTECLAVGMMGPVGRGLLDRESSVEAEEIFLWMKGFLESICAAQGTPALDFKAQDFEPFAAGESVAIVLKGNFIGMMGVLKESLNSEFRFQEPLVVAEIELEPLLDNFFEIVPVESPSIYPLVMRDYAFVVDQSVTHEEIMQALASKAPPELKKIDLFDVYAGKGVAEGKKSVAYRFTYSSKEKTLTDEVVNAYHRIVGREVCKALGAEIREG